ncbi:MAG TPA: NACHT domain-containing protein [Segetibacter sp.]
MYKVIILLIVFSVLLKTCFAQSSDFEDKYIGSNIEQILFEIEQDIQQPKIKETTKVVTPYDKLKQYSGTEIIKSLEYLYERKQDNNYYTRKAASSAISILLQDIKPEQYNLIPELIYLLKKPSLSPEDKSKSQLADEAVSQLKKFGSASIAQLISELKASNQRYEANYRGWLAYSIQELIQTSANQLTIEQVKELNSIFTRNRGEKEVLFWLSIVFSNTGIKTKEIYEPLLDRIQVTNEDLSAQYARMQAYNAISKMPEFSIRDADYYFDQLIKEQEKYSIVKKEYENNYAILKNKAKELFTPYDEEQDSTNPLKLYRTGLTIASLFRIVAATTSDKEKIVDLVLKTINEPIYFARSITSYDYEINFSSSKVYGQLTYPNTSIIPAFEFLGSTPMPSLLRLYDENTDVQSRFNVITAFGFLGENAKEAIPHLVNDLQKEEYKDIHYTIINTLSKVGVVDPDLVIPALIKIYQSRRFNDYTVVNALAKIANDLLDKNKTSSITLLKQVEAELLKNENPQIKGKVNEIQKDIRILENIWWVQLFQSPKVKYGIYILLYLLLIVFCFFLYWTYPLILFRINQHLCQIPFEDKIPFLGIINAPIRYVLVIGFFHYTPRVIDSWMEKHVLKTEEKYKLITNKKDLGDETSGIIEVYIPAPAKVGNKIQSPLQPNNLKPLFSQSINFLAIVGEGGVGKTSLARQIGLWALSYEEEKRLCEHFMFPIFFEQEDIISSLENSSSFENFMISLLKSYTGEELKQSSNLVKKMLEQRRILLVFDGFSELPDNIQSKLISKLNELSANSVILTTRHLRGEIERLKIYSPEVVKPMKFAGNNLLDFVSLYFYKMKSKTANDGNVEKEDFLDMCRRISLLTSDGNVSALLAKLFVDLKLASGEGNIDDDLPDNLPDLLLYYVNYVNRKYDKGETRNEIIHESLKRIARRCLSSYSPTASSTKSIIDVLGEESKAIHMIDHLEEKLGLVRRFGVSREKLRFVIEPFAEYLAAMAIIEELSYNEQEWRGFINKIKAKNKIEIKGFLTALYECCATKYNHIIPSFVTTTVGDLAGGDLEEQRKLRMQNLVFQIVRDLKTIDLENLLKIKNKISSLEQANANQIISDFKLLKPNLPSH